MQGEMAADRTVLRISGGDRVKFLGDLVTNDLGGLDKGLVYAALLSPQGKYLFDFFLFRRDDAIFLDVHSGGAAQLAARLNMYRLRADVQIADSGLCVSRGLGGAAPKGALADPRHAALGWRLYGDTSGATPAIDWNAIRVQHVIPETGIELISNDSYILECGFERLNGVNFRKGCYVGQEVTARMKHKTELRKGLAQVVLDAPVSSGTAIEVEGRTIGTVHTVAGLRAIAYLRFDHASEGMQADGVACRLAD